MYPHSYIISNNSRPMYRNSNNLQPYTTYTNSNDDRFFLAPFLFGGLAGTALGYGIANNNQINNRPCCFYPYPMFPVAHSNFPTFSNTNFYN